MWSDSKLEYSSIFIYDGKWCQTVLNSIKRCLQTLMNSTSYSLSRTISIRFVCARWVEVVVHSLNKSIVSIYMMTYKLIISHHSSRLEYIISKHFILLQIVHSPSSAALTDITQIEYHFQHYYHYCEMSSMFFHSEFYRSNIFSFSYLYCR